MKNITLFLVLTVLAAVQRRHTFQDVPATGVQRVAGVQPNTFTFKCSRLNYISIQDCAFCARGGDVLLLLHDPVSWQLLHHAGGGLQQVHDEPRQAQVLVGLQRLYLRLTVTLICSPCVVTQRVALIGSGL